LKRETNIYLNQRVVLIAVNITYCHATPECLILTGVLIQIHVYLTLPIGAIQL